MLLYIYETYGTIITTNLGPPKVRLYCTIEGDGNLDVALISRDLHDTCYKLNCILDDMGFNNRDLIVKSHIDDEVDDNVLDHHNIFHILCMNFGKRSCSSANYKLLLYMFMWLLSLMMVICGYGIVFRMIKLGPYSEQLFVHL